MAESITFQASKGTALAMTLASLAAAVFFFFIDRDGALWSRLSMAGCAVFAVYSALPLLRPNAVYLRLDEQSLEIRSRARGSLQIKWRDIHDVHWDEAESKTLRIEYWVPLAGKRVRSIENEYTAPLSEILATLNQWRDRYGLPRADRPHQKVGS